MALVLWEVCSIGIWTANGWRALVNWRERRRADLEVGKFIIVDFDRVPRVTVPSGHTLPSLSKPSQQHQRKKQIVGLPVRRSWDQDSGRSASSRIWRPMRGCWLC